MKAFLAGHDHPLHFQHVSARPDLEGACSVRRSRGIERVKPCLQLASLPQIFDLGTRRGKQAGAFRKCIAVLFRYGRKVGNAGGIGRDAALWNSGNFGKVFALSAQVVLHLHPLQPHLERIAPRLLQVQRGVEVSVYPVLNNAHQFHRVSELLRERGRGLLVVTENAIDIGRVVRCLITRIGKCIAGRFETEC